MDELFKYLDICLISDIPDGFIVEECSTYSGMLSEYCVVCREHNIPKLKAWIQQNLRFNVEHCITLLDKKPQACMKFLASNAQINSYTEEFVKECVDVNGFLTKYGALKPVVESADNIDVDITNASATSEESSLHSSVCAQQTEENSTNPNKNLENSFNNDEHSLSSDSQPVENNSQEETFVKDNVTAESEAWHCTCGTKNYGNFCSECGNAKEDLTNVSANVDDSNIPIVDLSKIEEKLSGCGKNCIYNSDGTFKGFHDGQIVFLLQQLKDLDKRVALDTLDPEYILDRESLNETSTFLESISPTVFKGFILEYIGRAESELDFIRVSVILDKFAEYLDSLCKK